MNESTGMPSKLKFNVNQNIVKLTLPSNAIHTHCEEDFVWSFLWTLNTMMTAYKNLNPMLWKCESFTQCTTLFNLTIVCDMFWMLSLHKENVLFIYKRMRTWNQSIDFLFIDYINIKALLYFSDSLSIPHLEIGRLCYHLYQFLK